MQHEGWTSLLDLCSKSANKSLLSDVFDLLFTLEEKHAMSGRVMIIRELMRGSKTQREIAKELKISIAKITRGSNALKTVDPKIKEFLKECLAEQGISLPEK